ncbi:MAG: GNAT family N-acetyltransferase [Clostridia bacterium]|nr:GNAT family N-acetyltransferase [Clostridia bacterium]
MKPRLNVVGAAIIKEGKLLALRRAHGNESIIHKFEFVGGKVEEGETPEEALARECMEELSLETEVGTLLNTVEYEYPDNTIVLSVYFVRPLSDFVLKEHEESRWITPSEVDPDDWAPADREFLQIFMTGYLSSRKIKDEKDFDFIRYVAHTVMHETFDGTTPEGQIDYMVNLFFSPEAVKQSISEQEYTYKVILLNGEPAGFYSCCPAKYFDTTAGEGTFLSKLYLLKFARGKRICSKILDSLRRPVYLTVKRDNTNAVNIYKHCGFRIVYSVENDIGNGYSMDDFIMVLGK